MRTAHDLPHLVAHLHHSTRQDITLSPIVWSRLARGSARWALTPGSTLCWKLCPIQTTVSSIQKICLRQGSFLSWLLPAMGASGVEWSRASVKGSGGPSRVEGERLYAKIQTVPRALLRLSLNQRRHPLQSIVHFGDRPLDVLSLRCAMWM